MSTLHEPNYKIGNRSRAWYGATIQEFLLAPQALVIATLALNGQFDLLLTQREAWKVQIELLKVSLLGLTGSLYLEFNIPRMGRRVDAVLLIDSTIFVLEFKVGETKFDRSASDQAWDYALDLKNFHSASRSASIVPLVIATGTTESSSLDPYCDDDMVYRPMYVHPAGLRPAIDLLAKSIAGDALDQEKWANSPYRPTPTIIEAARSLYARHSVQDIARSDANAQNLSVTSSRIEGLIEEAKKTGSKTICFITGVPGAGKTLVGLNVATRRAETDRSTHAVFLSGNGPLVAVLREALTRDELVRQKSQGLKVRKGKVGESVKAFIQNVHHFRDDALVDSGPPAEHVVIFDEAQRAWSLRQTASFMRRKKNQANFEQSEPEFLISYLDRHNDWAVIVCLIGGGQEINIGEAGIGAWLDAITTRFPHWNMFISSSLVDSEYMAGRALETAQSFPNTHLDNALHLAVSMRSFRAENVSTFVKTMLDCEKYKAREIFAELNGCYPIAVTRELGRAKQWIRGHARGTERYGLVASSKAQRLKPHAIDVRVDVSPVHWFLNGRDDTRSSYYLEDAATEFQVQGLELDWVCVTWDGDLRFAENRWTFHDFRGYRWQNIKSPENQNYLRNAYRVLLTRARQGMVIFIPPGDSADLTRAPAYYDCTFNYLRELGVPTVE